MSDTPRPHSGRYYALVAVGMLCLRPPALRASVMALALIYSLVGLRANYLEPYKENYRDALEHVAREYRAGDACLFLPFGDVPLQWSVYRYQPQPSELRTTSLMEELLTDADRFERVWVIAYRIGRRTPGSAQEQFTVS